MIFFISDFLFINGLRMNVFPLTQLKRKVPTQNIDQLADLEKINIQIVYKENQTSVQGFINKNIFDFWGNSHDYI